MTIDLDELQSDVSIEDFDDSECQLSVATSFLTAAIAPRIRDMQEFAEAEIVVNEGPHPGPFVAKTQPYALLWFALVASMAWNIKVSTGPSQSGKTLLCFIIPTLYHIFEIGEGVICLVPSWDMAKDKWNDDLLPAIEASRYKSLLPTSGPGSRGGSISAQNSVIRFRNGAWIKFMTGGGDDKSRAGKTARVLMVTEADGMDTSGEASRESDPITQTIKRTASHADNAVVYMECTVSIEKGRTWQELIKGTNTKIVVQCKSCRSWVTPEREHLHGYHDADNVIDAKANSCFICPACGLLWSEEDRRELNQNARVLHRGQSIDEHGVITGPLPKTDTFSFRWNAFNNLFQTAAYIGGEEWKASKDPDHENAEKSLLQFTWAQPFIPDRVSAMPLDAMVIAARTATLPRGTVPENTLWLSGAMDIGQRLCHWVIIAWLSDGTCQVVDYGEIKVQSENLGVEIAILKAMHEFYDLCENGWQTAGGRRIPDRVFIDSGKWSVVVYEFVREHIGSGRYWASKGFGTGPQYAGTYHQPEAKNNKVQLIKDQYHISLMREHRVYLVEMNTDHWKSFAHARLVTPQGKPGAMTLFHGEKNTHVEFAKHMVAEDKVSEFIKGKGIVDKWTRTHRKNHYFDAVYMACVAGHLAGFYLPDFILPGNGVIETAAAPASPPAAADPDKTFIRRPEVSRVEKTEQADSGWIRRRTG